MAISFSNNIKIQPITYQEFINSEYIPEYGEMVIISDYKQDENGINVPSFTVGDGSTMLKNLKISVDYVPTYTWGEINDKPTFADVATSGSYEDLSDKPTLSTFGITATATELNYTDGVTSNIQTQLNNKVTTNSDAVLKSLNIKGSANSTAIISSDAANNLFVKTNNGPAELCVFPTVVRPERLNTNTIELGNTDSYWKSVRSGKYIVHGGTSSQFLKADGSLDSTSYQSTITDLDSIRSNASTAYGWGNHADAGYATLNEEGKVEKSILSDDLGGREETFEEEFVFHPTANDLSIKDGYAKIKKIKGRSYVWNSMFPDITSYSSECLISGTNASKNGTYCQLSTTEDNYFRIEWMNNPPANSAVWANFKVSNLGYENRIKYITTKVYLRVKFRANNPCKITIGDSYVNSLRKVFTITEENINEWVFFEGFVERKNLVPSATTSGKYGVLVQPNTETNVVVDFMEISGINISTLLTTPDAISNIDVNKLNTLFPNFWKYTQNKTIISLDMKGIKTIGFNQFDGEKVKVIRGQTYYFSGDYTTLIFRNNIENYELTLTEDRLYTPESNGYIYATGSNICINFSHSGFRNSEYEEYKENVKEIDNGLTLSKVKGKLNGLGDSVIVFPDGLRSAGDEYDELTEVRAIKHIKKIKLNSLMWSKYESDANAPYCYIASIPDLKAKTDGISNLLTDYIPIGNASEFINKSATIGNNNLQMGVIRQINKTIAIYADDTKKTLEKFLTSIENFDLLYVTDQPEEYILDNPLNLEYAVYDFGTEEIIADQEDENVPIVPLRGEIQYGFNATDEIRYNRFAINDLKKKVQELSSTDVKTEPIQITYEELKTLRDSRELIKGAKYEITDYKTIINGNSLLDLSLESVKNSLGLNETISWATGITASTDERVLFNIIVTATDIDTLDANAIAIYDSERGSDYLSQAKVSQWELKYDLDNNTTKYAWASENGYGVIYYMKDEWGNECPYDFKSITFINTAGNAISDIAANKQYYTFTVTLNDGTLTDMSVPIKGENYSYLNISSNSQCLFNKISPCIGNLDGYNKLYLNNNIFHNVDGGICIYNIYHNSSFHNYYYNNCSNNTMHGKYYANIHGADCSNNKFAGVTWGNIFKDWASWSTFGDAFMKNTIGEYSYYNTFGDYVYNNTIGASSINNTFEQAIQNNTIGSEFVDNYIGQNFTSNTIGNKCKSNVFRGLFQNNTLGNSTSHCDFGVQTIYCKFGNSNDSIITKGHNSQIELGSECGAITFGIDCDLIKFYSNESTNTLKNKVFAVEVGDGNRGLYISSSDSNLDNVNIKRAVITTVGTITDDNILRLTINNTSTKYETIVTRRDNNDIYIGTMDNYYPLITEEDIDLLFN